MGDINRIIVMVLEITKFQNLLEEMYQISPNIPKSCAVLRIKFLSVCCLESNNYTRILFHYRDSRNTFFINVALQVF